MGNRTELGDLYSTNNELSNTSTLIVGTGSTTNLVATADRIKISDGSSNYFSAKADSVVVSNGSVSTTINATSFTGQANDSLNLGGSLASNYALKTYVDAAAGNAYSNSIVSSTSGNAPQYANNTNQYNVSGTAKNITDYPLNQSVSSTGSPTFNKVSATNIALSGGRVTETLANTFYAVTGTINIDLSTGSNFGFVLGGPVTFNFLNPPANNVVQTFMIVCKQDGTGSRTIGWPSTVRWSGGAAPTVTTTPNASDVFAFITASGGALYAGSWPMGNTTGF